MLKDRNPPGMQAYRAKARHLQTEKLVKVVHTGRRHGEFAVLAGTEKAQAALMELPPGGESDEELANEHPHSEQWLYVLSGAGTARIVSASGRRRSVKLKS